MYELVADVEHYPEFVPLCTRLKVIDRQPEQDGSEVVLANMTAAYKAFEETFTSRVTLHPSDNAILVEYVDGPFRHLENRWHFKPLSESECLIEFFIAYEFRSLALQVIAGAVFDNAFRKFVTAFEDRADALRGNAALSGEHPRQVL
jgi:coenzyme Q-binding protein COQ10